MSKKRHHKIRKHGLPPGTLVYTGHRQEGDSAIKMLRYSAEELHERDGFEPNFLKKSPGAMVHWVDVRGLTDLRAIEQVGSALQIHPLALEDVLDTTQQPKLEEYANGLFFIVSNIHFDAEALELKTEQIAIFCSRDCVASFQEDADDTLLPVCNRIREARGRIRQKGTDYLAYALVDTIIDNYYAVLDALETVIEELEESLHVQEFGPAAKRKIFALKRVLNQLRRHLVPMRDAAMRFYRTDSPVVDEANRVYFRDVSDHVTQMLDALDNQREMLTGIQELDQAEQGNRLNNVMRLLTVISTIFIPLSFIAGVYGMNFDYIPGLHNPLGFFVLSAVMFAMMVGMLWYFRWKKWI